jgi:hypothetical protein
MLKIYLCAFLNKIYIEEAKVCIESIRTNGCFKGTIYLFTDMDVFIEGVEIIKTTCASIQLSACYRTRLFDHIKDISKDDIFLYLDTDIVVLKPLPSFDHIGDKIHVYGYPSRRQKEPSFSGFITDDINYTSQTAICSGILLFRPSPKVKKVFDDIYKLYMDLIKKNKINACWEQPALCYILIEQDMYDISLSEYVYEERTKSKITDLQVFNHFCGMGGDSRYNNMKKYLKK